MRLSRRSRLGPTLDQAGFYIVLVSKSFCEELSPNCESMLPQHLDITIHVFTWRGEAMKTYRIFVVLVVSLLWLSSCGQAVDDFDGRIATVNNNIEGARNQAILLNIARARYGHPLNFISLVNIVGSGTMSGEAGLPDIVFGPLLDTAAPKTYKIGPTKLTRSVGASFTVNTVESKEFYAGLLTPLNMGTAQFFIAQGFSREMVYFLFVDALTIRSGSSVVRVENDPSEPSFARFVDYIHRSVDYGLSFETAGGAIRLCFDPALASKPLGKLGPVCGSGERSGGIRNFIEGQYGAVDVELKVRSTYKIFQYLGKISESRYQVQLRMRSAGHDTLTDLFPLVEAQSTTKCLVRAYYADRTFCIPFYNNENGSRVFELLTILVALNSSVKDLPAIQTIRVTQ